MDDYADSLKASDNPHHYADEHRFQPWVRVQHAGDSTEIYATFVDTRRAQALSDWRKNGAPLPLIRTQSQAKDPQRCLDMVSARRRRKIRLLCMNAKVDRMFTFTTRPLDGRIFNRDEFMAAWSLFLRRVFKDAPRFNYVAVHELQPESRQFHMHAGVRGRFDIAFILRHWRYAVNTVYGLQTDDMTGENSMAGVHVSYKPGAGSKRNAAVRVASYIAKYIGKGEDQIEFNKKGYFCRRDNRLPAPSHWYYPVKETLNETVEDFIKDFGIDAIKAGGECFLKETIQAGKMLSVFIRIPRSQFNPPPF